MNILEYADLDTSSVSRRYRKVAEFLANDDFASAEVKKLSEHGLYRAKLDDANRVIFKMAMYGGRRYALMLEIVRNHAYDRSRFLRGTPVDESKIPVLDPEQVAQESVPSVVYLNAAVPRFHVLDKIISFDPEQDEAYRHAPPLMVIGPAGSGKTALILEKLKRAHGQVLYITLSPYLAENARNIYFGHNYENPEQEVAFLSFREFVETLRVPDGREITYSAFLRWFLRFPRQQHRDAHRLYEEFRGVLTGSIVGKPWLTREDYTGLGVRQSIYLDSEREAVYTLFEKYLEFLRAGGYYDPNILAHSYLKQVQPLYDFIVVDEVQDITNIQLQLVLRSLKKQDHFVLCGDSNQIVHPNFFSWSSLKTMLYRTEHYDAGKVTRILQSNFRNSAEVAGLANTLLRIKQKRFGSVDRESAYLMKSCSEHAGEIAFVEDTDAVKRELNQKTRRSTKFALLVLRDEDKAAARQFFDTPLLFSIQEAKGLEYENVILLNFISGERAVFSEIIDGVNAGDLNGDIEFRRAADKKDKSLEIYKFFINSLYVAVTRAVRKLYLLESDTGHPLCKMLGMLDSEKQVAVDTAQSSIEEWQAEARKLELQGRQEQADDIRRDILKTRPVLWAVCTPAAVQELIARACDPKNVSQKPGKILYEYSLFYDVPHLMELLSEHGFDRARQVMYREQGRVHFDRMLYTRQRTDALVRQLQGYGGKFYKEVLRQCEHYGVDHRTMFNKTPLMLAALEGNASLIQELLRVGADTGLTDNYGLTAWQGALQWAVIDKTYAVKHFPAVHELLAPANVSLKVEGRLVKIDRSQGEFLLFHIIFISVRSRISYEHVATNAVALTALFSALPDSILPVYRKKRAYVSSLLAKNEQDSTNPYSRKFVRRLRTGLYILSPALEIRHKEEWVSIYTHLNIDLIAACGSASDQYLHDMIRLLRGDRGGRRTE
ncbi:MAG TPA: UvrD-helicase domain-containing protein [Dissulfurispiraceae bacterium]|nr:UvrD-helicase domain-containing protein [Dissulfurispiraceae bacterium]